MSELSYSTAEQRVVDAMLAYLAGRPGAVRFSAALATIPALNPQACRTASARGAMIADVEWTGKGSATSQALIEVIERERSNLDWVTPYEDDAETGTGFAEGAAYCKLIGPDAPFPARDVMAGLFVVKAGVSYFDHSHGPEELYLPIAGRGRFWADGAGWKQAGPDDVIVHARWQWHAMETVTEPVLILWSWLGPEGFGIWPALRPTFGGVAQVTTG
ncbi:MAG: dimethylsulfonioproprionate lyase family protein [Pseudomonadota bacterium]